MLEDFISLSLGESPRLENLSLDILLVIFSYLDTARSVASLAVTCKKLHSIVQTNGWRIFIRSCFRSLSLPQNIGDGEWMAWARDLTSQSRDWERRAFSAAVFKRTAKKQPGQFRTQTIPPHIVVDARSRFEGRSEREILAWGAGEDVVVRIRQSEPSGPTSETWMSMDGAAEGFESGKDDVTAISILEDASTGEAGVIVGRASGHLELLSTNQADFGQPLASFYPASAEGQDDLHQKEIQEIDLSSSQDTLAVITKDNALIYTWDGLQSITDQTEGGFDVVIQPAEILNLRNMQNSPDFRLLRAVKFMGNGDLAVGMTSSTEPLRYLTRTPTGVEIINAVKLQPSNRCKESYIYDNSVQQSVRGLLPVDTSSFAGGSGSVILSSYDDGTIRLQDLRSPSVIDTIYQDHFEALTPVGPLISHGIERFIAGNARASTLKFFDFRWTKSYYYTDSLPCSKDPLEPTPKPPTMARYPQYHGIGKCNHLLGRLCRCHALARTDFYRPNCNVYLPIVQKSPSPIYSLAKSSDVSSSIYVGLAGELVDLSLSDLGGRAGDSLPMPRKENKDRAGYSYRRSPISVIETGDGIALTDVSKSQRVPEIWKQVNKPSKPVVSRPTRRLDHSLI